ncbi:MAG: FmdB family transcriptional regulator [Mycobacterium sp.]|nr:FmdB family transcriptional regulator [Mycobacterium sp.]
MPTYSYACTECDHRFDEVQAFTDDALTACPKCSGRLRKLFNSVGVVFKGSGFYRTDSREPQKSSSASSADVAAPKADKSEKSEKSADSSSSTSAASGASKSEGSGSGGSSSGGSSTSPAPAAAGSS